MTEPYCNKLPYESRRAAREALPGREAELGKPLKVYRCRSRACRPLGLYHHTSRVDDLARRRRLKRVRAEIPLRTWEDDGGAIYSGGD
ncbi:hypothetical protein [Streptomyces mirabilis]|uniref:hypothetical protein n=1 Tax=Streptomyces mirabilis TaxID=68239 RepID=UPI003684155C